MTRTLVEGVSLWEKERDVTNFYVELQYDVRKTNYMPNCSPVHRISRLASVEEDLMSFWDTDAIYRFHSLKKFVISGFSTAEAWPKIEWSQFPSLETIQIYSKVQIPPEFLQFEKCVCVKYVRIDAPGALGTLASLCAITLLETLYIVDTSHEECPDVDLSALINLTTFSFSGATSKLPRGFRAMRRLERLRMNFHSRDAHGRTTISSELNGTTITYLRVFSTREVAWNVDDMGLLEDCTILAPYASELVNDVLLSSPEMRVLTMSIP